MEKEQRNRLQKATQDARRLLEEEFRSQLLQTYDIDVDRVRWAEEPGAHLQAEQRLIREKLVAWIEHKEAQIHDRKEALLLALREMAFTALNRFVALKLMEARELVRPCVSGGLESAGFLEFSAVAQGLLADQESSYRLYLETIFEDVSRELRALFDPRDPASLLWPKRTALLELLEILNRPELAELWIEDETLGWVYQYFNGDAERKKMREESSAPRNSRELAVRNQFFTPRYVVEFLTDNTLGRIWYEMRQGNTGLKDRCRYLVRRPNEVWLQPGEEPTAHADADEALSQEELLRQPVYILHRPLKDPREIRMLDPACGSMHFGLYAFDLYLEVYEEAWEIAQGSDEQSKQEEAFSPFVAYTAGFADKASFLREVPRLILQHNIHGIDIDPRATQIARLTLWLKAQRAWQEQQLAVTARPVISRSNVACAEPMPGERALLAEFIDEQFPEEERGLLQQLLEAIFEWMRLAGEAGSLLKIEEEIRDAINQARREWRKLAVHQQNFFSGSELASLGQIDVSLNNDLQKLAADFWVDIEERIYAALGEYAKQAENRGGFQRRLFAEDAAQGFAFIDICRKRYELVVMNPPFGDPAKTTKRYIEDEYSSGSGDILQSFVDRGLQCLMPRGRSGVISSRTGFFLGNSEQWRRQVVFENNLACFADLGLGVLDEALVEVASYVIEKSRLGQSTVYTTRQLHTRDKASGLLSAITSTAKGRDNSLRLFDASLLELIPDYTFGYWAPESFLRRYALHGQFSEVIGKVRQGVATAADFRFARLGWEVDGYSIGLASRWQRFSKGGEYSPTFDDIHLLLDWHSDGRQLRAFPGCFIRNDSYYFRPGATYSVRTASAFAAKVLPSECIFSHMAQSWFVDDLEMALLSVGFMSCRVPQAFIELGVGGGDIATSGSAARRYTTAVVEGVPSYVLETINTPPNHEAVKNLYSYRASRFASDETSCLFSSFHLDPLEPSIKQAGKSAMKDDLCRATQALMDSFTLDKAVTKSFELTEEEREFLEQEVGVHPCEYLGYAPGEEVERLYGLSEEGLIAEAISLCGSRRWFTKKSYYVDRKLELVCHLLRIHPSTVESHLSNACYPEYIHSYVLSFLSELFGCALGRWDVRYMSCEQVAPDMPTPFAPLPTCPLGQLKNAQGLPARTEDVPAAYPVQIPWDGILVDDSTHPLDLERRIHEIIGVIWSSKESGATAEAIEQEACEIIGVKTIRDYFRKPSGFFANHLSRYSKSRRQAPIYWQISAGSGSYSAWLYYHRFTQDTLYRVLRDFVEPRIQQAERDQFELESQGALSGEAATRLQETQTLLQDLRMFKSELDLVAPLWNPNLNDGVIINHAILWRITPYTPWQKKCKECWDKLVKGDYDWAHLAFHLWPERVIPKCVTDRSLAIAHGLEERLWQETNNGNWLPRQLSEADLQALIAEHSNPAVKSALERFLAAPPPVAPTRTRASRSTRASGSSTPRRARGSAAVVDAEATRQVLLALTAAPSDGLAKTQIADLIGVEANALTAVIKQLKESGQIDQLGERRGARYVLSEQGRAAVASHSGEDD